MASADIFCIQFNNDELPGKTKKHIAHKVASSRRGFALKYARRTPLTLTLK